MRRTAAPGTATALAAELGVSTGATSYHLRQLARHGLLTEVATAGRERRWQPANPDPDPATQLWLTPAQAARLASELAELVDRYRLLSHGEEGLPVLVRYAVVPADARAVVHRVDPYPADV